MTAPMSLSPSASFILTASGRRFDLQRPRVEDVDPLDIAHALANLCRFGGHTRVHYSVAQHSVFVSELVDPSLALAGLLHDAGEAYVGDVVGPLARSLPDFRAIEERVLDAVAQRFDVPRWQFLTPEVRRADAVALLTERRDLLPPSREPWAEDLVGVEPATTTTVPRRPHEARAQFLQRLHDLTTGRGAS